MEWSTWHPTLEALELEGMERQLTLPAQAELHQSLSSGGSLSIKLSPVPCAPGAGSPSPKAFACAMLGEMPEIGSDCNHKHACHTH